MSDPNPTVAEPVSAPAPERLALTELYPACFDWEQPKPLKIGIHRDLVAAGCERVAVQRALARYCHRPLYRRALRAGKARIDLHGQLAGVVTE